MFKNKYPYGKVAVAFILGAVTGAAAALLLTPVTGKKFQKRVKDVALDQFDNVEKIVKKVVNA